jgi:hypothetical protein
MLPNRITTAARRFFQPCRGLGARRGKPRGRHAERAPREIATTGAECSTMSFAPSPNAMRLAARPTQGGRQGAIAEVEHRALQDVPAIVEDETQAPAGEEERQPMTARIVAFPTLVKAGDLALAHMRGDQSGIDAKPSPDRRGVHMNDAVSDLDPIRRCWLPWHHPHIPAALFTESLSDQAAGDQGKTVALPARLRPEAANGDDVVRPLHLKYIDTRGLSVRRAHTAS